MIITHARLFAVVVQYTINGNLLSTTFNYGCLSSVDPLESAKELKDEFESVVLPLLLACLSVEVTIEAIYVHSILKENALPWVDQQSGTIGLVSGNAIPSNLAVVFQLRQTEEPSRHNGRLFISGLSEDTVVDGLVQGVFLTGELATLAAELITPLVDTALRTWYFVVVRRVSGGLPVAIEGLQVVQCVPTYALASQRRRTTELRRVRP